MSQFDTNVANSIAPDLKTVHGVAVTYTTKGGSASAVTAMYVIERPGEQVDQGDGRGRRRVIEVAIATADVASPSDRGRVTFNSETWEIESVDPIPAANVLVCVRYEPKEKTIRGYRMNR